MYACKQCGTGNPLDSSFCKKCGSALPADDLAEARGKLNELLDEGNSLFTEGRTDEALLIAETAVNANPSSHLGYSLKGLCHERMGQVAEALECYEIAVGLNPDSSLDKVKVAALRNRLAQRVADAPPPSRRNAAMIAVAAGVLVLVGASFAAIGMTGNHNSAKLAANTPTVQPSNLLPPAQTSPTPNSQVSPQAGVGTPEVQPQVQAGPSGEAQPNSSSVQLPTAPPELPFPDGSETLLRPINPSGPITGAGSENPPPAANTGVSPKSPDPAPAPLTPTGDSGTKPAEEQHGYIHIEMATTKPDQPGGSAVNGGQAPIDGNGITAVMKAAQNFYQVGNYDAAAEKYRQAASLGANSPHVQQRIGDCYRNAGKAPQARAAYNLAITMYQAQIKQGRNVVRNQQGLDTCESALKVLGG